MLDPGHLSHHLGLVLLFPKTLSTQLPIEHRAVLKVGLPMRASTQTALRAYGQFSQSTWFIRTFGSKLIPYLGKQFHQL